MCHASTCMQATQISPISFYPFYICPSKTCNGFSLLSSTHRTRVDNLAQIIMTFLFRAWPWLLLSVTVAVSFGAPLQDAFSVHNPSMFDAQRAPLWANSSKGPRKLHGRFLHITDMHPDPYYTPRTSLSTSCHRKKSKKKKNKSLYFGTPYSWVISFPSSKLPIDHQFNEPGQWMWLSVATHKSHARFFKR